MKRTFLFVFVLIALTGCAPAYGVLKTYTGQSPVVEVAPGIFIGNRYDAANEAKLKALGITARLNVAREITDPPLPGVKALKVGITEENCERNRILLQDAKYILDYSLGKGDKILVHCWFGENRTPWVIAHYLAEKNGTDWRAEFANIKAKRPECYIKDWMF